MSKTTEAVIRKTTDAQATRFSGLHDKIRREQRLYRADFRVPIPSNLGAGVLIDARGQAISTDDLAPKLGTCYRLVDEPTDHILLRYIQVFSKAQSDSDDISAENRGKFLSGFWHMAMQQGQVNALRQFVKNLFASDIGFLKVVPDVDAYQDPPVKEEDESDEDFRDRDRRERGLNRVRFPYSVSAPNPIWMVWDIGDKAPRWIIERHRRRWSDILSDFPEMKERFPSRNEADILNTEEWWDEETFWFGVDGEMLLHRDNQYGVPIMVKMGGFGQMDEEGRPELMIDGILSRYRSQIIEETATFNQIRTISRNDSWPELWANDEQWAAEWRPGIGTMRYKPDQVVVGRLPTSVPSSETFHLLTIQQEIIARDTHPSIVSGVRQPGTSSAAETALQVQQARMRFESVLIAVKGAVEMANVTVLRILESIFPAGVRVYGRTPYGHDLDQKLERKDIHGAYANEVELMAGPPEDLERQAQASLTEWKAGARSLETHLREGTKRQDPKTELIKIASERAFMGPMAISMIEQVAAQLFQRYMAMSGIQTVLNQQAQEGAQNGATPTGGEPVSAAGVTATAGARAGAEVQNAQDGNSEGERAAETGVRLQGGANP